MPIEILGPDNAEGVEKLLQQVIKDGIDFKLQDNVAQKTLKPGEGKAFIEPFPEGGVPVEQLIKEFKERFLPYCTNFSSPQFMGFPDAGNSVAALAGGIAELMTNQNLINQSFCSPVGTFAEISVLQWLRETVGYEVSSEIKDIWDVGGIITPGGTGSNATGILLAREHKFPNAMEKGVTDLDKSYIVVPKGIGHYSVKSAQMWAGLGNRLIEVGTKDFKYDLDELDGVLRERADDIMCLVAYCGDSRTMTVDNFNALADRAKTASEEIWLHADACHGFSLGFSPKLKGKIKGIERFDSITMDPHKVMTTPYVVSALLVREPSALKTVTSLSDLIMQEPFAFGQVTPFLGSRPWNSLKLWFMMKNAGREGLAAMVEHRHDMAIYLAETLKRNNRFVVINDVDINSVAFLYKGDMDSDNINGINQLNKRLHDMILAEGKFHLHQFSVPDSGKVKKDEIIYPLRFMTGNLRITTDLIDEMVEYVASLAKRIEDGSI
ncbi:MAG: pyridoxal-dependent decarboxylase [Candidatus Gracilibacteria bacterium]|jgi:L-2,4-diaminobutyrate decarboxylase